jgi:hypothetical protein
MSLKMVNMKDIKMPGSSKQFEAWKDKIQDQELHFMKMVSYSNLIAVHRIGKLNITTRISKFNFKIRIISPTYQAVDSMDKWPIQDLVKMLMLVTKIMVCLRTV